MKNYKILILFLAVMSCKSNNKNYTSAETILSKKPLNNTGVVKYPNGELHDLVDSVKGKEFGNLFEFYQNSYLSSYSFKIDPIRATYIETFDSITHKIKNIDGSPIVYKAIDADSHPDSIYVQYLVSNFSYDNIEFEISDSGRQYKRMSLNDNILNQYANLKFLNAIDFIKDVKTAKRFYLIGKFTGVLKNTGVVKTYYDTIDYSKRQKMH